MFLPIFSTKKEKNLLSQRGAILYCKFLENITLVGCYLLFILVLIIARNIRKNILYFFCTCASLFLVEGFIFLSVPVSLFVLVIVRFELLSVLLSLLFICYSACPCVSPICLLLCLYSCLTYLSVLVRALVSLLLSDLVSVFVCPYRSYCVCTVYLRLWQNWWKCLWWLQAVSLPNAEWQLWWWWQDAGCAFTLWGTWTLILMK